MNINSREKRNITEGMKNYLDDKETCIFETLFTYDGKKIIMFVAYTDKFEIWSMNIDGSDKKNLTRNLIMDKELLHIYRAYPAMYELDVSWAGFEWINANDSYRSIFSFIRKSKNGKNNLLFVINMTPMRYDD